MTKSSAEVVDARARAVGELSKLEVTAGRPLRFFAGEFGVPEHVDLGDAWLFNWNSVAYIEGGSPFEQVLMGPIVVPKDSGEAVLLGTAGTTEERVEHWRHARSLGTVAEVKPPTPVDVGRTRFAGTETVITARGSLGTDEVEQLIARGIRQQIGAAAVVAQNTCSRTNAVTDAMSAVRTGQTRGATKRRSRLSGARGITPTSHGAESAVRIGTSVREPILCRSARRKRFCAFHGWPGNSAVVPPGRAGDGAPPQLPPSHCVRL